MANEKWLIDVNALIEQIRLMANRTSLGEISPSSISSSEVCHLILTAPTVDAVEVVRCKDCKNFTPKGMTYSWCDWWGVDPDEDDFCSHGERRTDV